MLDDEVSEKYINQYETLVTDASGRQLIRAIFPLGPQTVAPQTAALPQPDIAAGINILSDVPAFTWCYGCSATSAAMLFGYYDRTGYGNMYAGPTNGGVMPLDNSIWGHSTWPSGDFDECPLSATHNGIDDRVVKGHVDDYWIDYGEPGPDPWVGNWTEHVQGECTGDYMGTNQWKYGSPTIVRNTDGGTTFWTYNDGSPLPDSDMVTLLEPTNRDGGHGMRLFAESRGYTVTENYNQLIKGQGTNPDLGFTFADYMAEIDAGYPVLINVVGHSMLGFGYDTTGNTIYLRNTWDHSYDTMTWGGTYSGMQHRSVSVIHLAAAPSAPTVTNGTGASNVLSTTARLNGVITDTGGESPEVHIYWGDNDGATTPGNWDHDVDLGIKGAGAFYTDVSGLAPSSSYYYRCYAENSNGGSWASSSETFLTLEKLIGVDEGASYTGTYPANFFFLYRFQAEQTGDVLSFRVKTSGAGYMKVAIYADNGGEPGALLNAVNTSTAVVSGWNGITIPSTSVTAGTYYWLAYTCDAAVNYYQASGGTFRYKTITYSSFTFPNPAGSGFSSLSSNGLVAGWGVTIPPEAPTVTNSTGASNIGSYTARLNGAITDNGNQDPTAYVYWGDNDGGTTAGNWDHVVDLGVKGVGTFYTDIASLTASTPYYYRCYAINSGGGAWAGSSETFTTLAPPSAPTVTNSTGASSVTSNTARLNGEVTGTGGENPTVHVYWGPADGGTTPGSWAHDVDLGVKGAVTFYTDISSLTASTPYYYRCYAVNSGGGTWAASSETFTTAAMPQKLIGVDVGESFTGSYPANYFFLYRFQAVETGNMVTFKIKTSGSGHVKVAIYADNGGEPGALLNSVDTSTAVVMGWNDITIASTSVTAGSYYWLSYISDANIGYYKSTGGTLRYKTATYSTFTFPGTAGTGFGALSSNGLVAGWGIVVPPTPPPAPGLLSPATAITFKWGAATGATTYYLEVNTSPTFDGTSIYAGEVGNVTSYEVSGFTIGVTYYWRVKAGNAGGWGPWSLVMSIIADFVP